MSEKYSKNVTIALTDKDHDYMSKCASDDRRSLAQYLSIIVEKEINARRRSADETESGEGTDG